jgi:hemoglobin/transferrin/lactoferrin receptor protein
MGLSAHSFLFNFNLTFMKMFFSCCVGVFLYTLSPAQNLDFKIIDQNTLQPVPGARVWTGTHNNPSNAQISNISGTVTAPSAADSLFVQALGYGTQGFKAATLRKTGKNQLPTVYLKPVVTGFDEVVVSASRFSEKKRDVPQQIATISTREIENASQPTTAELLSSSGQVFVQKSQLGGGSPVMRGFEASRVSIVVDGVRMNNAIFRGGHLQNILSVDQQQMEQMELVFGPGSLMYGSDAMGGVMHIHTKKPLLAGTDGKKTIRHTGYTRYSSAYSEKSGGITLNIGGKKWAWLGTFSYNSFGDLRQGNIRRDIHGDQGKRFFYQGRFNDRDSAFVNSNTNMQSPSGYDQWDVLQKLLFKQSENVEHMLNFQHSQTTNFPRFDRLSEGSAAKPSFAEWFYGPQIRTMAAYHLNWRGTSFFDNSKLTLAYQNWKESRNTRAWNSSGLTKRNENVDAYSLNWDFEKLVSGWELRYGIESILNDVQSSALRQNILTWVETPASTRYPARGSSMMFHGAYLSSSRELSESWVVKGGLRWNYVSLKADFNDTTFFPFPGNLNFSQNNMSVNGNLGLVWLPTQKWRISVFLSNGFKAPNVDDLSKVFESNPSAKRVILPNPDLKPENIYNAEIGLAKISGQVLRIEAGGWYSWYNNAIGVGDFSFNGSDSVIYDGVKSKVVANINRNRAQIMGCFGTFTLMLPEGFKAGGSSTFTLGEILTDTNVTPLDHIPPFYGRVFAGWQGRGIDAEFFCLFNAEKPITKFNMNGEDNPQYALPSGSPAWYTLNARIAYQISRQIRIQAALENIFDVYYRTFSSGLSGPGRNFSATLRWTL